MKQFKTVLSLLLALLLVLAAAPTATFAEPSADGCDKADDGRHVWKESDRKAPTCTDPGYIQWTCAACGITVMEKIPAHFPVPIPSRAATCTEDGLTEGSKCSVCGQVLVAQEIIPATGHTVIIASGREATCTEDGLTDGQTCSVCGAVFEAQEAIPATGHTPEVVPGTTATCTEDGLTDGQVCSVCGEVLVAQETIPATGHTPVDVPGTAATCTEDGLTDGQVCSICGEVLVAQEVIPATGHTPVAIPSTAATCTEDGLAEGSKCSVCGEVLVAQETIPATGHTVIIVSGREATDTEDGLTDGQTCSVCGAVIKAQETIHTWSDWTVKEAPTCTEDGAEIRTCSACGAEETRTIDAYGHRFGDWITDTPATCIRKELQYRKCGRCGVTQWRSEGELSDHSWDAGELTTLPKGFTPGEKTFTCTVCGATKTESVDPVPSLFQALAAGEAAGVDPAAADLVSMEDFLNGELHLAILQDPEDEYVPGEPLADAPPLDSFAGCWKAQYVAADGAVGSSEAAGVRAILYIEGTKAALGGAFFGDVVRDMTYEDGALTWEEGGVSYALRLQEDGFLRLTLAAEGQMASFYCQPHLLEDLQPVPAGE